MKKRLVPFFLLIIYGFAAIFCTDSLFAQNYQTFKSELDNISQRTRWRIGPFYLDPAIQLNLEYDSNIYGYQQAQRSISDYVATISPQVTSYLLFGKWLILSFLESPQYIYFVRTKNERAFNNSYSPSFKLLFLNRIVISGACQFSKVKLRQWSEIYLRIMQETKGYAGSIFYDTSRSTSLGLSGSIMKISYGDIALPGADLPLSRALSRDERSGRVEFYYRVFSESFFFMNMGYTEYKFNDPQAGFRDSYSYQGYAGIRFPLLGRARGTLSLGYKKFIPRQEGWKGFSGVVGDTSLSFRFGRFGFRFEFVRDIPFSYGTNIFYINNIFAAGLSFYLMQSVRLDYNFSYGEGKYPEPVQIPKPDGSFDEITRRDLYRSHSLGVVFRIIKNTGIGLTANYWERKSNYFLQNDNRLLVRGYVTYDF